MLRLIISNMINEVQLLHTKQTQIVQGSKDFANPICIDDDKKISFKVNLL